jgi:hypothetical protein
MGKPPKPKRPPAKRKQPPKSKKPTTNAVKKIDKRGCPKGKGTRAGKGGGGRIGQPPFKATDKQRELVLSHAACGTPRHIIADEIGISEDTLTRHFRKELDDGLPRANARLGGVLFKAAEKGDMRALEQWFDRRGGAEWKKKTALEHSGPNGAPIEYRDLSDEELEARIAAKLNGNVDGARPTRK